MVYIVVFSIKMFVCKLITVKDFSVTTVPRILKFGSNLLFPISHLNVMHREIYVKDFPRTTVARILKFGTNIRFDYLYCVRDSASSYLSFPLFAHFSFPPITNFITDVSGPTRASLQILYSHTDS